MAILDESHRSVGVLTPDDTKHPSTIEGHTPVASNISPADEENAFPLEKTSELEEKPSEDAQNGVKKIEAVTLAWSKKSLAGVLILYVLALLRVTVCIANIFSCR